MVYCDFDFSVAGEGYTREPHHDRNERIMVFLYYINSFESNNGGNLQIFDYINKPDKYLNQPIIDDLNLKFNIEPQKGTLITFLSSFRLLIKFGKSL